MGARAKLNAAHINGALLVAGVVGYAAKSWLVFWLVLAVIIGGSLHSGGIRPRPRSRSGRRGR